VRRLATLALYWRTLRHLKPVQFYGRLVHRLPVRVPTAAPTPALRSAGPWVAPARRLPSQTGPASWCFLGESRTLHGPADWDRDEVPKLWRYNLHYFDDLNAIDAAKRSDWHHQALRRWMDENPPAAGSGWEPYPCSLRIVNWIKWARSGGALDAALQASLAQQTRWLMRRLEYHLLGNHLFANAKALVFAGSYFQGPEAEAWLARGVQILQAELGEQVLADGGHFERSTMYHALALEDLLDLVNLGRCYGALPPTLARRLDDTVPAMVRWLQALCHPDGELSFFNDTALGIAPATAELLACAQRLDLLPAPANPASLTRLEPSGYLRATRGPACLLVDAAPIGPDYLPGHAHADTLSFELSLGTDRLFVNSGTSQYGLGAERLRQRGTAAHNTVVLQQQDSSEVWSGFRVGRRARVVEKQAADDGSLVTVSAAHDGYRWLPGRPVHRRQWQLSDGGLRITDRIDPTSGPAEARFHLHPLARVTGDSIRLPGGTVVRWTLARGQLRWEASSYHPQFGLSVPNPCLVVDLVDGSSDISFHWTAA
jgi:uncharacterized heparinase superfamily protein